jgi:thioredoxin
MIPRPSEHRTQWAALWIATCVVAWSLSGCERSGAAKGERITSEELKRRIDAEAGLVVVDFWATWCGPCIQMKPVLERVVSDFKGQVRLIEVDIDVNSDVAREYGVSAIPTLIALRKGEILGRQVGGRDAEGLRAWLGERLPR